MGLVTIAAVGGEAMERARQMVQAVTAEPVVGETYEGTVKSTTAFGAFIEIMPGTEGAAAHLGDAVGPDGQDRRRRQARRSGASVKLIDRDERGRLRLSMKALQPKPEGVDEGNGNRRHADRSPSGEQRRKSGGDEDRPRRGGIADRFGARVVPPPRVNGGPRPVSRPARPVFTASPPLPSTIADQPRPRSTTLPNGLIVTSERMPGVRSVALGAWVRAASLHERPRR